MEIEKVLVDMKKSAHDPKVQEKGCKEIAKLAEGTKEDLNDPARLALMKKGAGEIVFQAMKKHEGHTGVAEMGCLAVWHLGRNIENDVPLMRLGAGDVVTRAMKNHAENAAICLNACGALRCLSFAAENKIPLMQMGAAELIIQAMRGFEENVNICEHGCVALQNLSYASKNKAPLRELGAGDVVIRVMKKYEENVDICDSGCGALWSLSSARENQVPLQQLGAADVIIKAMKRYQNNEGIREYGTVALYYLSGHPDNWSEPAVAEAIEVVQMAISQYPANTSIREWGSKAIDRLRTVNPSFEASVLQTTETTPSTKINLPPGTRKIFEEIVRSGASQPLGRGKIMMTGPGRAGKSGTVRSLLGKSFDPNLESTIGADANGICSVDRNENVVNWAEKEKGSEFAEHSGRAVASRIRAIKGGDISAPAPAASSSSGKERRPSLLQTIRNSLSMKSAAPLTSSSSGSEQTPKETPPGPEVIIPQAPVKIKEDEEVMKLYDEKIIGKMIDSDIKDDTTSSSISLSIWDLGGQEVFYTLHHLFLTKYALYLCIFDMRHMISTEKQVREKSLEFTNFWLRSIQMHAGRAPVVLVGTFKDVVGDVKTHQNINKTICLSLNLNDIAPTLVMNEKENLAFWPIDNTKGGKDPVVVRLREVILESVNKMEHISMQVPLAWTLVYDRLMATKKNNLTMKEVSEIASQNNITDKKQVTSLLNLFHELGMILYFSQTEELRDLVVLNPQWLEDALTMVIRDFELHPYKEDLISNIILHLAKDFKSLTNDSIASIRLMNRLWREEDGGSEIDYTRRKFLISLMEKMTLSSAWRFGESTIEQNSSEDWMRTLPPPTQYLVPSNLRLFRSIDVEGEIRERINGEISSVKFDGSDQTNYNCFIIDFTASFLPIGFFDRLVCLLVAYSSVMYKKSRKPLIANGSALLSFGMNDFRIDEDIPKSRIVVTIGEETDRVLVLTNIESMIAKLKDEVMGALLKYRVLLVVWREGGKKMAHVDLDEARDAVMKKISKIRDVMDKQVKVEEFKQWVEVESTEPVEQITQTLSEGKSAHIFIASSNASGSVSKLQKELVRYGVKIASTIDSAMCLVLILSDKVFDDPNVQSILRHIRDLKGKQRTPVILVQEGDVSSTILVMETAPDDIRAMLSNFDPPIKLRIQYQHEVTAFLKELCGAINSKCAELLKTTPTYFLAFLSHVKKDAGTVATLLQMMLHAKLHDDGNSKERIFLDCDHLSDLRRLPDQVKQSRVMVTMLTEYYLTRPWCLLELHVALENSIPIVAVHVARGGYDFEKASAFLQTLTEDSLDEKNKGASLTMKDLGVDVIELGKRLHAVLPNMKAINFDPSEAPLVRSAQVETILQQIQEKAVAARG